MGSLAEIKSEAAKRLGCQVDDIIYKIELKDDRLIEVVASHESWARLAQKGKTIHCFVKTLQEQQRKRKSISQDESDPPQQVASTSKSISPKPRSPKASTLSKKPRDTSTERLNTSKSMQPPSSQASSSITTTGRTISLRQRHSQTSSADRGGFRWSPKEDGIFWNRFKQEIDQLPANTMCTVEIRTNILEKIHNDLFKGKRTVPALEGRMRERIKRAISRGDEVLPQCKLMFPTLFQQDEITQATKTLGRGARTFADENGSEELSSPDTSESGDTPPPRLNLPPAANRPGLSANRFKLLAPQTSTPNNYNRNPFTRLTTEDPPRGSASPGTTTLSAMAKKSSKELPVAPVPQPHYIMRAPPVVEAAKSMQKQQSPAQSNATPASTSARVTPASPISSLMPVTVPNSTSFPPSASMQTSPVPSEVGLAQQTLPESLPRPRSVPQSPVTPRTPIRSMAAPAVPPSTTAAISSMSPSAAAASSSSSQQPSHTVIHQHSPSTPQTASIPKTSTPRNWAFVSASALNPVCDMATPAISKTQERQDVKMEQDVAPGPRARNESEWPTTPPKTAELEHLSTTGSSLAEIAAPSTQVASLCISELHASAAMPREVIVIKDESEDELLEEGVAAESISGRSIGVDNQSQSESRGRASSVKAENREIRETVREKLKDVYPVQSATILPHPQWATSLAEWLKSSALQDISDKEARIEILMACFDEFFYTSWDHVNKEFSILRACLTIVLLLLDLFHALSEEVEECQAALVNLFYHRLFHSSAQKLEGPHTWPLYDLCAAAAHFIPTRPSWLITQVCERHQHFAIEQVPPPIEQVEFNFTHLQGLLRKIASTEKYCDRETSLRPLLNIIHAPYIDLSTLANLRTSYRQSQTRLSPSVKKIVEVGIKSQ